MYTAVARVKLVFGMTSDYKKKNIYIHVFVYLYMYFTCTKNDGKTLKCAYTKQRAHRRSADCIIIYMRFRSTLYTYRECSHFSSVGFFILLNRLPCHILSLLNINHYT